MSPGGDVTNLDRREFLLGASLGPSLGWALGRTRAPAWLGADRPADGRVLVIVQLRGGNDGLNTLVPFEDDRYHRARPNLRLDARKVLRLDDLNGLHPALTRTARRFREGGVGIVQGIGYPRPNLSHFRSQDVWDAASTDALLPASGWLGRLAALRTATQPGSQAHPLERLAIGRDVMPHALRGGAAGCAVPSLDAYRIRGAPRGAPAPEAAARLRTIHALNPGAPRSAGDAKLAHLASAARAARLSLADLEPLRTRAPGVRYPASDLARDLRLAAGVIGAALPVRFVYVTLDGFDTHVEQAGTHHRLLVELDQALDAFLADLQRQGALERTLVMTVSEFGRRVAENGIGSSAGTDHGAASVALLFGGGAAPGIHGAQPDLEALDGAGNQVHRVDFRQLYASVVEDWFGGDALAVLGGTFPKLEVLA